MTNKATQLRGEYEEKYEHEFLTDDVIDTIVMNFEKDLMWTLDTIDETIIDEPRKLRKTLKWQSDFNRKSWEGIWP